MNEKDILTSNEHFLVTVILEDAGIPPEKAYDLATKIIKEIIPPKL